jgi:hypothetical protein
MPLAKKLLGRKAWLSISFSFSYGVTNSVILRFWLDAKFNEFIAT